jgi:hypothetical protein
VILTRKYTFNNGLREFHAVSEKHCGTNEEGITTSDISRKCWAEVAGELKMA